MYAVVSLAILICLALAGWSGATVTTGRDIPIVNVDLRIGGETRTVMIPREAADIGRMTFVVEVEIENGILCGQYANPQTGCGCELYRRDNGHGLTVLALGRWDGEVWTYWIYDLGLPRQVPKRAAEEFLGQSGGC